MIALPLKRLAPGNIPDESNDLDRLEQIKICKKIMATFEKHSELIPNTPSLPMTRFQKTNMLDYLPRLTSFENALLWSLAQALLDNTLREWFTRLVEPGLENALLRIKRQTDDPWAEVFIYLCFGQLQKASEKAKSMNAFQMAMLINMNAVKSMQFVISNQIEGFKETHAWEGMTVYEQKVWYLLSGTLDLVSEGYVVTENQSWQCTLSMYVFYAQPVDEPDKLSAYHDIVYWHKKKRILKPSLALQKMESPDEQCLWYQLLKWWFHRGELLKEWPLELTWLLSFYRPDRFTDDSVALQWIDRLQKLDLPEHAIFACLFLKHEDVDKHLSLLLQSYEWDKEDMLLEKFYIPKDRILLAKALTAHEEWDFEAEYKYFLQASHEEEAKEALFNFLLPKLYKVNDESCLLSSLDFIKQYNHQQDEEIKLFRDVYSLLLTKEGDKEELVSTFERIKVPPNRSFNFFKLVNKLKEAFQDI